MVDCGVGVWVFVTGGNHSILPCTSVGVREFGGCWVCIFGDGGALPVSAFGKHWAPGWWHRIKNYVEMEEIKLFALYF